MKKKHHGGANRKGLPFKKIISKTLSKSYIRSYFGLSTDNFPFKIIEVSDGEDGVDIYPAALHMGAARHIDLLTGKDQPSVLWPWCRLQLKSYDAEVLYLSKSDDFIFKAKKVNLSVRVSATSLEKRFGKGIIKEHVFLK